MAAKVLLVALCLVAGVSYASARACNTCDVEYKNCVWKCYQNKGWRPSCTALLSAKQEAMGTLPDKADFQLFSSPCDAQCYVKGYGAFLALSTQKSEYAQSTSGGCEDSWKTQAALDYQRFQKSFLYNPYLKAPPAWLQQEVDSLGNEDADAVEAALEKCMVCDESLKKNTAQDMPPPEAQSPPTKAESPPPDAASPPPEGPVVVPVVGSPPPPAMLFAPMPAPMMLPVPAPLPIEVPVPTPAPVPVPVPVPTAVPVAAPSPSPVVALPPPAVLPLSGSQRLSGAVWAAVSLAVAALVAA